MSIHKTLSPSPFLAKYGCSYSLHSSSSIENEQLINQLDRIHVIFLLAEKIKERPCNAPDILQNPDASQQIPDEGSHNQNWPKYEKTKELFIIKLEWGKAHFFIGANNEKTGNNIDGSTFFGERGLIFLNRLQNATDNMQITVFTNLFLMSVLCTENNGLVHPVITAVANRIINNPDLASIDQLAVTSNMSLRNFERRFFEQIGISPKLFCRIARFNRALEIKKATPGQKWAEIAYDCGYCNQTHFTREFKYFAGKSPSAYLKHLSIAGNLYAVQRTGNFYKA